MRAYRVHCKMVLSLTVMAENAADARAVAELLVNDAYGDGAEVFVPPQEGKRNTQSLLFMTVDRPIARRDGQ